MDKNYDPAELEARLYQTWEKAGDFAPKGDGEPYCIVLPPPNVTGTLHMGHAFQGTLMDCLARYHRMLGRRVLWQPGTDHAGIATQMVVERQLEREGLARAALGREAFIERVWRWRETSAGGITRQFRRLGASLDWRREVFTMDPGPSKAVREAFVRLHEDGLIYRGKRLVNWDPALQTAVSDLEVVAQEERGHLWHIRYPLADGDGQVSVATTRPETLFGDVAVAVHPEDPRYRDLVGRRARLPLAERELPIIADAHVDPEFGSGCVKITPAHDFNDHAVGRRHDLPAINIFNPDATLNDAVPPAYRGLAREDARKRAVEDLRALGLLEDIEDRSLNVPRGERSGVVIEPLLSDQWFVRAKPLAEAARRAGETGAIGFVPDNWRKTYFEWLDNIEDWCVSRQIWWGHRIPAWHAEDGQVYVARSEEEARAQAGLGPDAPLRQDDDVLDTWFSSGLWPFSIFGWPGKTDDLKRYYPSSVLVTGFDILFFWVARMAMMGLKFMEDVPFHKVYVHGLVRDARGQKMSKSKGNTLDPVDLIDGIALDQLLEKRTSGLMQPRLAERIARDTRKEYPRGIPAYGADALRFTFAAMASHGRDIRFDLGRIEGYRNFCNKLWNAARLVRMLCDDGAPGDGDSAEHGAVDLWLERRLQKTIEEARRHFSDYRFDLLAGALYHFAWHDYCDWFLEFSKCIQRGQQSAAVKAGNRRCMLESLETLLRLLHPIVPFVTEEIWLQIRDLTGRTESSIQHRPYPNAKARAAEERTDTAAQEIAWVRKFVTGIRQLRAELQLPPDRRLPIFSHQWERIDNETFKAHQKLATTLAGVEEPRPFADAKANASAAPPPCAAVLIGSAQILVPLEGLVDVSAETARLEKQISEAKNVLTRGRRRLDDDNFAKRAPVDVVDAQRRQVTETETRLKELELRRAALG